MTDLAPGSRIVPAVHGRQEVTSDPADDLALAEGLREDHSHADLLDLASKYAYGLNENDVRMRRAVWRALTRRFGHGIRIGRGALVTHPETFEIGDGVFIGEHVLIQGRFDGRCVIGDHTWIGPQSCFDAGDLVIEEHVGWDRARRCSAPGRRACHSMCRSFRPTSK